MEWKDIGRNSQEWQVLKLVKFWNSGGFETGEVLKLSKFWNLMTSSRMLIFMTESLKTWLSVWRLISSAGSQSSFSGILLGSRIIYSYKNNVIHGSWIPRVTSKGGPNTEWEWSGHIGNVEFISELPWFRREKEEDGRPRQDSGIGKEVCFWSPAFSGAWYPEVIINPHRGTSGTHGASSSWEVASDSPWAAFGLKLCFVHTAF